MDSQEFDLLVIGGGINGVAIACDAAGRGLSVCLCDQGDLASATSSWSTKLIHGGLRYLEQYEFRAVKKALQERDVLMTKAPFLVKPLEFILPHVPSLRPAWMVRLGLRLYDFLDSGSSLPRSKRLKLQESIYGMPLKPNYKTGFSYHDCYADDARLVVLTARHAEQHGAVIMPRTRCRSAERQQDYWRVELEGDDEKSSLIKAKVIVNASGPWVQSVATETMKSHCVKAVTLVQGSHFVVPRCYQGDHAYIFQSSDGRVIFTVPFHHDYTLVGTTDQVFSGDLYQPTMSDDERDYLCREVNAYLRQSLTVQDILWSYSGVRTLYSGGDGESASKISREYHLLIDEEAEAAPAIHVVGGKITSHRVLADEVLELLSTYFPDMKSAWTKLAYLPGGNLLGLTATQALESLHKTFDWLPETLMQRYWDSYGMEVRVLLEGCQALTDLGQCFGADLYVKEVDFLCSHEWAMTADDILWRRILDDLQLSTEQRHALESYLNSR